tara:strand:- start:99 stop:536 length:438 start_codon:yes stop_codon:yes gene_type:complete
MIECKLREFAEFHSVLPSYSDKKTRKGFYSHTVVPIRGLGRDKWLVIVHIDVDYGQYIDEGVSEKDIYCRCVDFLNQPPPRKKYAKKKPKPLYGQLTLYKAKLKEDEGGKYIEAELTTDQKKNKNFWREGIKYGKVKLPFKLRRK